MRNRVYSALILSGLLIGATIFIRFYSHKTAGGTLSIVSKTNTSGGGYEEFINTYLNSTSTTAIPKESLSNTDLIGRQLMSDYIALSSNGQANEQTLDFLAQKYVDSIPTLISSVKAEFKDLKIVANNKANFENYGSGITKIYSEYASTLLSIQSQGGIVSFLKTNSSDTPQKMGGVYAGTANKLKTLPVPSAVSAAHLDLINVYLENASAMNSLSKIQNDPASAFAGLLLMNGNIEREALILGTIQQILTANGI